MSEQVEKLLEQLREFSTSQQAQGRVGLSMLLEDAATEIARLTAEVERLRGIERAVLANGSPPNCVAWLRTMSRGAGDPFEREWFGRLAKAIAQRAADQPIEVTEDELRAILAKDPEPSQVDQAKIAATLGSEIVVNGQRYKVAQRAGEGE